MDDGAEGIRTPDLLLAKEALSQLSYGPDKIQNQCMRILNGAVSNQNLIVGLPGLEPETSVLSGLRSNQLS